MRLPTIRGHDNLHATQIIKAIKLVQKLHPQMARSSGGEVIGGLECMLHGWWYAMGKCGFGDFGSFNNFFLVFTSWSSELLEDVFCFFSFVGCVLRASLRWHLHWKHVSHPWQNLVQHQLRIACHQKVTTIMISEIPLTNCLQSSSHIIISCCFQSCIKPSSNGSFSLPRHLQENDDNKTTKNSWESKGTPPTMPALPRLMINDYIPPSTRKKNPCPSFSVRWISRSADVPWEKRFPPMASISSLENPIQQLPLKAKKERKKKRGRNSDMHVEMWYVILYYTAVVYFEASYNIS